MFNFQYYMGLAYYDKKNYDRSIEWYDRALQMPHDHHYKVYNSKGITYDDMNKYDEAEAAYKKCMELNPKYHSAYYNLAIVYKRRGKVDGAIEWYKKAIKANPRYSYAYNNLGNIYKDRGEYDEAIECYRNAVEHTSTYTLAWANMAVCLLKVENYNEAFRAGTRAKECLPNDNNNLSQNNKNFLSGVLKQFEEQKEKWGMVGYISAKQKQALKNLISDFEKNFRSSLSGKTEVEIQDKKVKKKEILEIVQLVYGDQFELKSLPEISDNTRKLFFDNQEYFHILPLLFIQYFWNNATKKNRPIFEVQEEL